MVAAFIFAGLLPCFSVVASEEYSARAFVTLRVKGPRKAGSKLANVAPFVTEGSFAAIGPVENVKGDLCVIDNDFFVNFRQTSKRSSWVGLIYHEEDGPSGIVQEQLDKRESRKPQKKNRKQNEVKKKSLSERMKDIILLGASALIIMVKNVKVRKEFDVAQVLTKPVVFLHGVENVTKILQLFSLRYDIFVKIQRSLPYYSVAGAIGTVTLWATCGRSTSGVYREWQGVVCIGNSRFSSKTMDEYFTTMTWNACFLVFVAFVAYVYIKLTRTGLDEMESETVHEGLARHILSQMRIEIYRSHGRKSRKKTKKTFFDERTRKKFENLPEECAICLDSFFPLQRLRVLPCKHCFHLNCIDRWLVLRHTCPICKFNILEQITTTVLTSRRVSD